METYSDTNIAYQLLNEGSLEKALEYAKHWLQTSPNSLEALQFCGIVYAKQKDYKQALQYFQEAQTHYPHEASCHTNLSNVYVALGDLDLALRHLYQALRLNPRHVETYNNLGRLLYKKGCIEEAITNFEKALRMNSDFWEAHYNLAHSLTVQNQIDRSMIHYKEVIRLFPHHPIAHFNLGLLYVENQDYELAAEHLQQAISLDQNNIEALKQLGEVYVNLGKPEEAIALFEKALILAPTLGDVHHNLAILYLRNKLSSRALHHFKEALVLNPTNDTARHMVMALSKISTETAPTQYITALFDQYADYYNEHLKTKLKYAVPVLLRNAIGQCLQQNPKTGRVLDLGCGTGLCGIMFRDLARELIGVDLSPKMIEKAKLLEAYDKLAVADINDYLLEPTLEPFDFIIAADVFVYQGELKELFNKIAKKLHTNGLFAFTTEYLENGTYTLQTTGRFAHSIAYLHNLAKENAFSIEYEETITLREQEGIPIQGQIIVFKLLTPIF